MTTFPFQMREWKLWTRATQICQDWRKCYLL